MTFDARTAEPGSRWITRSGRVLVFNALINAGTHPALAEFEREGTDTLIMLQLDGRLNPRFDCATDIIAPEPEAKPAEEPYWGDGCDHEGFEGGCERFGHTPETCPHKPAVPRRDSALIPVEGRLLNDLVDLEAEGKVGQAVNRIVNGVDDLLLEDKFREVDWLLGQVEVSAMSKDAIFAMLGVTFTAAGLLPHREAFCDAAEARFAAIGEDPKAVDKYRHKALIHPAEPEPAQGEEVLQHSMNCPQEIPNSDEGCTCGLRWRRDLASRDETIKRLEGENKEYLQKIFLMYHAAGICDGSDEIESVKRLKADRDTLQSDNARLTAELSAARERVTVLEVERDEAVDVIDGLMSYAGLPVCRNPKWDEYCQKSSVILERRNIRDAALSGSVEDA